MENNVNINLDLSSFDFSVFVVEQKVEPIVVLTLKDFLQLHDAIVDLNRVVKNPEFIKLSTLIHEKFLNTEDIQLMFKDKKLTDASQDFIDYINGVDLKNDLEA